MTVLYLAASGFGDARFNRESLTRISLINADCFQAGMPASHNAP